MAVLTADPPQLTPTVASGPAAPPPAPTDPSTSSSTPGSTPSATSGLTPTVASAPPAEPDIVDKVNTLSDSQRKYFFSQMNENQRTRFQAALQAKIAAKQAQPPPTPGPVQQFQTAADKLVNAPILDPKTGQPINGTGFDTGVGGLAERFGMGWVRAGEAMLLHPVKSAEAAVQFGKDVPRAVGLSPEFIGQHESDPEVQQIIHDARGRLAAQYQQAKEDPAGFLGQLAGAAAVTHGVGKAVDTTIGAAMKVPEKVGGVVNNVTGTTTAVEKAGEAQVADAEAHQQKVQEITEQNEQAEKDAAAKSQQNLRDAVVNHSQLQDDAVDLETQRGDLARREMELRSRLADRVRAVADQAKSHVDSQWDEIRSAVKTKGVDEVPADSLVNKVEEVKAGFKGKAQTTPEFEAILRRADESASNEASARVLKDEQDKLIESRNMPKADGTGNASTYSELSDAWKGVVDEGIKNNRLARASGVETLEPPGNALSWDHLRTMSSELGDYLRQQYRKGQMGGDVNGELVDGVQKVKAHVDAMVDDMAQQAKVSSKLKTAKQDYQIYRDTFREPTGPSGSGSGVAQSLNARPGDIYNATQPFLDPHTGQLARNMLTGDEFKGPHWDPRAGQLVDALRNTVADRKALPKAKEVPEFQEPKPVQPPKPKEIPEAPEPLDLEKIKRDHIVATARRFRTWQPWQVRGIARGIAGGLIGQVLGHAGMGGAGLGEVYGGAELATAVAPQILSRLIDTDAFKDFISKPKPRDMQVLAKLKGADKIRVQDGVTGQILQVIKSGEKVKVAPEVQGYVGHNNIIKIAKAIYKYGTGAKGTAAGMTGADKIRAAVKAGVTGAAAGGTQREAQQISQQQGAPQ